MASAAAPDTTDTDCRLQLEEPYLLGLGDGQRALQAGFGVIGRAARHQQELALLTMKLRLKR